MEQVDIRGASGFNALTGPAEGATLPTANSAVFLIAALIGDDDDRVRRSGQPVQPFAADEAFVGQASVLMHMV